MGSNKEYRELKKVAWEIPIFRQISSTKFQSLTASAQTLFELSETSNFSSQLLTSSLYLEQSKIEVPGV